MRDFCVLARHIPHTAADDAAMSPRLARAVLAHNEKLKRLCDTPDP